jgi:hypothetical protein
MKFQAYTWNCIISISLKKSRCDLGDLFDFTVILN